MRGIEPLTFSLPRKRSTPELHRLIDMIHFPFGIQIMVGAAPLDETDISPLHPQVLLLASGRRGSNPRPAAWKAAALPTELLPHCMKTLWG